MSSGLAEGLNRTCPFHFQHGSRAWLHWEPSARTQSVSKRKNIQVTPQPELKALLSLTQQHRDALHCQDKRHQHPRSKCSLFGKHQGCVTSAKAAPNLPARVGGF